MEFDVRKLQRAEAVRNLEESVIPGRCHTIEHYVLGQHKINRAVQSRRDHLLAVVVINLHLVEALEIREVVGQENDEVALESRDKRFGRLDLASFVGEAFVGKGASPGKALERRKQSLPVGEGHSLVIIVAVHQRRCMKGDVGQPFSGKVAFVSQYQLVDWFVLIVKQQRHETETRMAALASRFVYEDAKLLQISP